MSFIIVVLIIWLVIAYIYSKVKNVSLTKAIGRIPVFILSFLFENPPNYSNIKAKAKKQGRQDVVDKINQQEEFQKNVKERLNKEKEKYKQDK